MPNHSIYTFNPKPGINRDGTQLDSENYVDGQWCRFYKGKPRKIGGYNLISPGNNEIVTDMIVVPRSGTVDLYMGRPSSLNVINFNLDGTSNVEIDRTPVGFVPNPNNTWSFDIMTRDVGGIPTSVIIAQVSANGSSASSNIEGGIYYGAVTDTTPLQPVTTPTNETCSGGIVVVPQVLMKYGNQGMVEWSATDDPTTWPPDNTLFIAGTKIVYGARTRGGGTPAALFWSLNAVTRLTYNATADTFIADTIEDNISIFSTNCVVKAGQMFFWIGAGQFYFYNGTVQDLPNSMSTDFFFNNVNMNAAEKVQGVYNSRYKEIWWLYPTGANTQCNHALIYNIVDQTWYDTEINRSTGYTQQVFPYPIMADTKTLVDQGGIGSTYGIWMHEYGHDMVFQGHIFAIPSRFESNLIMFNDLSAGNDLQIRTRRFEPDFDQIGPMTIQTKNRAFPSSAPVLSAVFSFDPTTEKVDVAEMGRIVSYVFESNAGGGFYQGGRTLINIDHGDIRPGS